MKLNSNQFLGILLLIAAILSWVPLGPLSGLKDIGPLIVIMIGIYLLFK